jgi:nucleoside-diphosphate-sugar epimerase
MNPLASDLNHILSHTQGLWEEFSGKNIFITGGTGFFGSWLLESWAFANDKLKLNAKALVLTRDPLAFKAKAPHLASHPSIDFHTGDIRSFEFPKGKFSHVIHAATEASAKLNEDNPALMLDTILTGTRRALDFAVECGASKFLLTSSGAIYGRQPPELQHIHEDYPGAPDPQDQRAAYGLGKRSAEFICTAYQQKFGLEAKIARCFAFVGPHLPLDTHFAIGNFIRDGLQGGPIKVAGDGTPYRSYLYAADLTIWLWTILAKGTPCRAYNVGSDQDLTIEDLAKIIATHFGVGFQVTKPKNPGKPAERYVPSTQRAQQELGLKAWVDLKESILRTAHWHKKHKSF